MKCTINCSILALYLLPTLLTAQRVERFDDLGLRLKRGDRVVVETVSRQTVRGTVTVLTHTDLAVKDGDSSVRLLAADIALVTRSRRHVRTGMLVGVGAVWVGGLASPCREDCELIPVLLTPVGALLGAGVGALLSSREVVYERIATPASGESPSPRRATILPMVHRGAFGARVAVDW